MLQTIDGDSSRFHNRMPVILDEASAADWINWREPNPLSLKRLLPPAPDDLLVHQPLSGKTRPSTGGLAYGIFFSSARLRLMKHATTPILALARRIWPSPQRLKDFDLTLAHSRTKVLASSGPNRARK